MISTKHNNHIIIDVKRYILLAITVFAIVGISSSCYWLGIGFLILASMSVFMPIEPSRIYWLQLGLLLFSNLSSSIFSPLLADKTALNVLFGLDFLLASLLLWWNFLKDRGHLPVTDRIISVLLYLLFALAALFYLKGLFNNGFSYATIYLRMILYPFILFLLGGYAATHLQADKIRQLSVATGILLGLLLIIEILIPADYYTFLNVNHFFVLKSGRSYLTVNELIDLKTIKFFNSNWGQNFLYLRPFGGFLHPISTAYFFTFNLMLCLAANSLPVAALFFLLIILCGAKGALICALALIGFYCLEKRKPIKFRWVVLSAIGYIVCAYLIGLKNFNPHFYSLTASLLAIPENLWGQGFGYGGSVTTGVKYTYDFVAISGDSGLAVLLNMIGICAPFVYLAYIAVLHSFRKESKLAEPSRFIYSVMFCFLLANSLFQEEGFSPYGMGLLMFFIGFECRSDKLEEHKVKQAVAKIDNL